MTSTVPATESAAAFDINSEVLCAARRIRPLVRETPLEYSPFFSEMGSCSAFLKLENLQHTGSFKVRGALNKLLTLSPAQRGRGIVAASSGNHGIAIAYGTRAVGARGIIFIPEDASPAKVNTIRRYGADVHFYGPDCVATEAYAREYAARHGMVYVSPYNDPEVIGGQGAIAVEIVRQLGRIDVIFVALGGGGMISGIGAHLKANSDDVRVIGCSPENSPVMVESVRVGRLLQMASKRTLSDGTAGGVEPGSITFDLCRTLVDDYVLVSEEEIAAAMGLFMEAHGMPIEGAAGVAIASFLRMKGELEGKRVVIVICGGNLESLVIAASGPRGRGRRTGT